MKFNLYGCVYSKRNEFDTVREDAKSNKIDAIQEFEWLDARFTTKPFLICFEHKFFVIAIEGYLKLRNQTL